jgi:hypothetical protein
MNLEINELILRRFPRYSHGSVHQTTLHGVYSYTEGPLGVLAFGKAGHHRHDTSATHVVHQTSRSSRGRRHAFLSCCRTRYSYIMLCITTRRSPSRWTRLLPPDGSDPYNQALHYTETMVPKSTNGIGWPFSVCGPVLVGEHKRL